MINLFSVLFIITFILILTGCLNESNLTGEVVKENNLLTIPTMNKTFQDIKVDIYSNLNFTEGEYIKLNNTFNFNNTIIHISFTEPLSKEGEWQTKKGDLGVYLIEVLNIETSKVIDSFILRIKKKTKK